MSAPVRIPLAEIYVGARLRQIDRTKVKALAGSIEAIGLKTPVTVRKAIRFSDGRDIDAYEIVAGHHRYEAAKLLKWTAVECFVTDDSEALNRLWEIDENLIRAGLSGAEEAEHHAERKRIMEELGLVQTHGGERASGQNVHLKSYADEAAEQLGVASKTVRRHVHRGEKIAPDVLDQVKQTPELNKGVVLDQLARMSHEEQRETVAAGRRPVPPPPEVPDNDLEPTNKIRRRMANAWNAAPPVDREWFREWIDRKPVMDRGRAA